MAGASDHDLFAVVDHAVEHLDESLAGRRPMTPRDWLRVIQATELVFPSDSVGAGVEWSVTRFTDGETVGLLRSIQEKFASAVYSA